MAKVHIRGIGLHPFGRFPQSRSVDLAAVAVREALADANLSRADVDAVVTGHALDGSGGGTSVAGGLGFAGIPVLNLNAACASSSVALCTAASAVASGQWGTVLVLGFERMERGGLATTRPHDPASFAAGLSMQPTRYALKAKAYMARFGVGVDALAAVTVKSRAQAALNPNAHLRAGLTLPDVLQDTMIAEPLTRSQCCPTSDGASALILSHTAAADSVVLHSWVLGTPSSEEDPNAGMDEALVRQLSTVAYERSGIGPDDVDVAQVHDAFTIGELTRTEALGLIPNGEAGEWTLAGRTTSRGDMPVNTDGGLLSRGHPLGATGAAQVAEVVTQLRGRAGGRQIEVLPRVGVCQNTGGGENGASVVAVLSR